MAGPARRVGDLGPGAGAHRGALRADRLGVMAWTRKAAASSSTHPPGPRPLHGTGDIFSAACAGAMVRGKGLPDALRLAADFTLACIQATQRDPNAPWYGVEFEKALHLLPGLLER